MIHALELPWGKGDELKERFPLRMIKGGIALYSGALLPAELRPFASEDFSYSRWLEDERNATVIPPTAHHPKLTLRSYQQEAAESIFEAYEKDSSGVFLGDARGSGKKLSALAGLSKISRTVGFGSKSRGQLLVVCPKGKEARWRRALQSYPLSFSMMRVLVINYTQLSKLLVAPPQARLASKASAKSRVMAKSGVPTIDWDFVVFDDSHILSGYPRNKMALEAVAVAKLNSPYVRGESPFVIFSSSSPGSSPLDFSLMSKLLASQLGCQEEVLPKNWDKQLKELGFSISQGRYGAIWTVGKSVKSETREILIRRRREMGRLASAMKNSAACIVRRDLEFDSVEIAPLVLTGTGRVNYVSAWNELRTWTHRNIREDGAFEEKMNDFRRAVGFSRNEAIRDEIVALRDAGPSTIVWVPTQANAARLVEQLIAKKIPSVDGSLMNAAELKVALSELVEGDIDVFVYSGDLTKIPTGAMFPRSDFELNLVVADAMMEIDLDKVSSWLKAFGSKTRILLCELEKTFEGALLVKLLNERKLSKTSVERAVRVAAAKKIDNNRLS